METRTKRDAGAEDRGEWELQLENETAKVDRWTDQRGWSLLDQIEGEATIDIHQCYLKTKASIPYRRTYRQWHLFLSFFFWRRYDQEGTTVTTIFAILNSSQCLRYLGNNTQELIQPIKVDSAQSITHLPRIGALQVFGLTASDISR